MKKSFLLCLSCIAAIGAMLLSDTAIGAVSPDGLELVGFNVVTKTQAPKVGNTVKVTFALKNTSGGDLQFNPSYGVFVGARWNSTTDANNRDFGHKYKGKVLKPGREVKFTATRKLDAVGTWRFWPAYNIGGHWGPFRWREAVVQVSGGPPPPRNER